MKKLLGIAGALLIVSSASATMINVTTADGLAVGQTWGAYDGGENDAVNFGSNADQRYDLEAFFFDREFNVLEMQSGFNVDEQHVDWFDSDNNGQSEAYFVELGDIFIDIGNDGDFDFAVAFNRDLDGTFANDHSYQILDITGGFTDVGLLDRYDGVPFDHLEALPFAVATGGVSVANGTFNYSGDYLMSNIDLSSAVAGESFTIHQTMSCGNDVMVGRVPEPTLLSLLGMGLIGLVFFRRKK